MTKTKSFKAAGAAGISHFASLRARLSCTSTEKYSVVEKEKEEGVRRGPRGVELMFKENKMLKKGLSGEKRISIRVDKVEGVSCIQGTFKGMFGYLAVGPLGFTRFRKEEVATTFTITL